MDDDAKRAAESQEPLEQGSQQADCMVNWDDALAVTGDDVDLLLEMLDAFQIEMPQVIVLARESLEKGDAKELRRAAHMLKNGYYNVGARQAGDVAFELEMIAAEGGFERARPLLSVVAKHLEVVEREVDQFIRSKRER